VKGCCVANAQRINVERDLAHATCACASSVAGRIKSRCCSFSLVPVHARMKVAAAFAAADGDGRKCACGKSPMYCNYTCCKSFRKCLGAQLVTQTSMLKMKQMECIQNIVNENKNRNK